MSESAFGVFFVSVIINKKSCMVDLWTPNAMIKTISVLNAKNNLRLNNSLG